MKRVVAILAGLIFGFSFSLSLITCVFMIDENKEDHCETCGKLKSVIDSLEVENARLENDIEIYKYNAESRVE